MGGSSGGNTPTDDDDDDNNGTASELWNGGCGGWATWIIPG